jgi:hypothetical protein
MIAPNYVISSYGFPSGFHLFLPGFDLTLIPQNKNTLCFNYPFRYLRCSRGNKAILEHNGAFWSTSQLSIFASEASEDLTTIHTARGRPYAFHRLHHVKRGNFREGGIREYRSQPPQLAPEERRGDPKKKNILSISDLPPLDHPFHHPFHLVN